MATKLYVGGLSYSTSREGLEALFSEVGTVLSAIIVNDRETGRSKGFGFVEMSSQSEADEAISEFHGQNVDGRVITVNEARERSPRRPRQDSRW